MPANNQKNPFLLAPASALAVLVLLSLFGFLKDGGGLGTFALILLFVLLAFLFPFAAYLFLRGGKVVGVLPLRPLRGQALSLTLTAVFALIFGQGGLRYALFGAAFDYQTDTLYGFSFARPETLAEILLAIVAVVFIPAVCEELFFRGAMFYEYRFAGIGGSIVMSSLLASLLASLAGLSFFSFPELLLSALVFSVLRFLTGNMLSPILAHILYNLYLLFGERYVWLMSTASESRFLFGFLMFSLFGLCCVLWLRSAELHLRERANANEPAPFSVPKLHRPQMVWDIMTAPPLWMIGFLYLLISILGLYFSF